MARHASKKKRIAVIGAKGLPSTTSGLEVYVETLTTALADEFDFTVFCRKRYCDKIVKEYNGVKVVHIPSINTKHLDAISYSVIATIVAIVLNYDAFWYQALGPAVTMWIPRLFGKRIISTVHGLDWKREKFGKIASAVLKAGEKSIARKADCVIVLNRSDQCYFKEAYGRECQLIPNGVTIHERIPADLIKSQFGLVESDYYLFMSRIVPEKNVHILIRAFMGVDTEKKLVIAGKGVHTDDYNRKIINMARNDRRIMVVGHVSGVIKEELYSNAYMYVLPSTVEGMSIGLLEAMSYGLPCIVSRIEANEQVVRNSGLYVEAGEPEELKRTIEFSLDNVDSIRRMGELAKHMALEEYRLDDTVEMTRKTFATAIL